MHQLCGLGWQITCHSLLAVYSAGQLHVHRQMKSTGLEQVKVTIFFPSTQSDLIQHDLSGNLAQFLAPGSI